jgi:hypothetical protein
MDIPELRHKHTFTVPRWNMEITLTFDDWWPSVEDVWNAVVPPFIIQTQGQKKSTRILDSVL